MSPSPQRTMEKAHGHDGVGVAILEPVRIQEHSRPKTTWRIERWNRRGLRCTSRTCRHEIVEAEGRQYDPYDKADGLIFAPKGKIIPIERHPFRVVQMPLDQMVPRHIPHRRDQTNVYIGRQPIGEAIVTLGAQGLVMRCPCCGEVMVGFSPDREENRLPDAVDVNGELSFFDPIHGNVLCNEGITELCNCVGNTNTPITYQNSTAQVGTGTGTTAADPTDTDLEANGVWKAQEGGYPSVSSQTISWKGSFGAGDANQAWDEYSTRNSVGDDLNLHHKIADKGEKSGGTWTLQVDILFA